MRPFILGQDEPGLHDVVKIARQSREVRVSDSARQSMLAGRKYIDELLDDQEVVYGVTTGFGKFSDTRISEEQTLQLQKNLLRSHAVAVGDPLEEEIVRAVMFLRALALSQGNSGVRPEIVETLVDMLNENVIPRMPQQGSLGASGDLAPLSHMGLVLMGEGEAYFDGELMSGKDALQSAHIQPVTLAAREGLALINGTQVMTALGILGIVDAMTLCEAADLIAALTMEALRGIIDAFDARIAKLRPHPGQAEVAQNIRRFTFGSDLITTQGQQRVQDAYSLRCITQVHGAVRDALSYVWETLERELCAVTDNPLVFAEDGDVLSGGNFHGEPVAFCLDHMTLAITELGNISERRTERLLNPAYNEGLPAFLTPGGGLNSGLMIAQYTAASLTAENKLLASPASADTIPSSAGQEDHVSMGTTAARQGREAIVNLSRILAVEAVAAAQGIDLRLQSYSGAKLGDITEKLHKHIRRIVPELKEDRTMSEEIENLGEVLKNGQINTEVRSQA